jgi:hypothetical protein
MSDKGFKDLIIPLLLRFHFSISFHFKSGSESDSTTAAVFVQVSTLQNFYARNLRVLVKRKCPDRPLQPGLMFVGRLRLHLQPIDKKLDRNIHSSLGQTLINYSFKMLNNIGCRCQCYKNFNAHNLQELAIR